MVEIAPPIFPRTGEHVGSAAAANGRGSVHRQLGKLIYLTMIEQRATGRR
jgi:hypothetical protein